MRRKTWAVAAGVSLLIVLGGGFFLRAEIQAHLNPGSVQKVLAKALGVPVRVGAVGANWRGGIDLSGVKLGEETKPFLSAPLAHADIVLPDLLRGKISVKSADLIRPQLALDPETVRQLSALFRRRKAVSQAFPLAVSGGTFSYAPPGGATLLFNRVAGGFQLKPGKVDFHLTFRDGSQGSYELSGTSAADALAMTGIMRNAFGLFHGDAAVSARLAAEPSGMVLDGTVEAKKGQIQGLGNFDNFRASFSTSREGFVFQNGRVHFPGGVLGFSGVISANGALKAKFQSGAFNPFVLPAFAGVGIAAARPGKITGSVQGRFHGLTVAAEEVFPDLEIGKSRLHDADLKLKSEVASQTVRVDYLKMISPQASLSAAGRIQWDKNSNVHLAYRDLDAAPLAALFHWSRLFPMKMLASGTASYRKAAGTWRGTVQSAGGVIAGERYENFSGKFSHAPKGPLSFSGIFTEAGKSASVSGTWESGRGTFALDASGFPLENIPLLSTGAAGGFRGPADIHGVFSTDPGSASRITFALAHVFYKGKAAPAMEGTISVQGDEVHLAPVKLSRLNPPLFLTGDYNFRSKAVNLTAALKGQSIGDAASFLSAKPARISGLLYGSARITGIYPRVMIAFDGTVAGVRLAGFSFHQARLNFLYQSPWFVIRALEIPATTPAILLSGRVNPATGLLDLRSALAGQSIADLAKLISKPFGSAQGNLYGTFTVSGAAPRLKAVFSGTGKNLFFSGMSLGNADLRISENPSGQILIRAGGLDASRVSALQQAFPGITGSLSLRGVIGGTGVHALNFQLTHAAWKGKPFPAFQGKWIAGIPVTRFSQLTLGGVSPSLSASGQTNSNTHVFRFTADLKGQSAASLVSLLGAGAAPFDARLYGPILLSGSPGNTTVRFSGTARELVFHGMSLGSGHLDFSLQSVPSGGFAVSVGASGIPAGSLGLLAAHFPGMSGVFGFHAAANTADLNRASIDFSLTNASYRGRAFPEVAGKTAWDAPRLDFNSLSLPGLSPPLGLSGAYNSAADSVHLAGRMQGQSLSDLMLLAGAESSPANGRLYGPLTLDGPVKALRIGFHGQIEALAYKGLQLGTGKLDVSATPASLNGRLVLNNPASISPQNSLLPALLSRIPQIGSTLGGIAQNVVMTGVKIGGTPRHPQFEPIIGNLANLRSGRQTNPILPQPSQQQPQNPIFNILNQILH